jgi:membrane protein
VHDTVAWLTRSGRTVLKRLLEPSATDFGVIGVAFTLLSLLWAAGFVLVTAAAIGSYLTVPTWRHVSPGSVTPPSSSTSPARGS